MEAIVFTAQGDLRQGLNNLQSTFEGFGVVTADNVFRVCDEPHPLLVANMLEACAAGQFDKAHGAMTYLQRCGYAPDDIVGMCSRVTKSHQTLGDALKLEFLKAIAAIHVRVADGIESPVQFSALIARLCRIGKASSGSSAAPS